MIKYRSVADLLSTYYQKKSLNDIIEQIPKQIFEAAISHATSQNQISFLDTMTKHRDRLNSKYELFYNTQTRFPYLLEKDKDLTIVELAILCAKCNIDETLFVNLLKNELKSSQYADIEPILFNFTNAVKSFENPVSEINSVSLCYVCGKPLDEKISEEHIILDSLGGTLKAKLLHTNCNSLIGARLDSDFCNQMQILAKMIGVQSKKSIKKRKRLDKSEYPSIDILDEKKQNSKIGIGLKQGITVYTAYRSGKTSITYFENEDNVRGFLRKRYNAQIKQGKSPSWHPDTLEIQTGQPNQIKYLYNFLNNGKPSFRFGGDAFYKSFLKMSINYYLYNNLPIAQIHDSIQHLLHNDGNYKKYSALYYTNEIKNLESLCDISSKIYHLLYLKGDPKNNSIYCYVDLFGSHKVVSVLSNNYFGKYFEYKWCYDLINKSEISIENFVIELSEAYLSSLPFVKTNLTEQANNSFKEFFLKIPNFIPGITAIINDP